MRPKPNKDGPTDTYGLWDMKPLTKKNVNQSQNKDKKSNVRPVHADIRGHKAQKVNLELKTPAVIINLTLEAPSTREYLNTKSSKHKTREILHYTQGDDSTADKVTSKSSLASGRTTPIRSQNFFAKKESPSVYFTKPKANNGDKNDQRISSVGNSPFHGLDRTQGQKIPVFPSKANFLSQANSERATPICRASPICLPFDRSENSSTPLEFQESSPQPAHPQSYYKKKIMNKMFQKNISKPSVSQSTKNIYNKPPSMLSENTHYQNLYGDIGFQQFSARSFQRDDTSGFSTLMNGVVGSPRSTTKEIKSASTTKPKKFITPLKIPTKRRESSIEAQKQEESTSPYNLDLRKVSVNNKTPLKQSGAKTVRIPKLNTTNDIPLLPLERINSTSNRLEDEGEQTIKSCREKIESFKPIYFQPIEDFKLCEFIENVRNPTKTLAKVEVNSIPSASEVDIEENEKPLVITKMPGLPLSNFSSALVYQKNLNRRNTEADKDNELFKRFESQPIGDKVESSVRFQTNGSFSARLRDGVQRSFLQPEPLAMHSARINADRAKTQERIRNRKPETFEEAKQFKIPSSQDRRGSHTVRLRFEDNLSSTTDSWSNSKLRRTSLSTRIKGDRLTPKAKLSSQEKELNTFSKLDELLKTIKDEKADAVGEYAETLFTKNVEQSLFARNFEEQQKDQLASLSCLRKSLAKILITRNEDT